MVRKYVLIALLLGMICSSMAVAQQEEDTAATQPAQTGRRGAGTRQTDAQRRFGDAPDVALPMATDVSADLKPKAVSGAMKKVADWQLKIVDGYINYEWTFGPLITGFLDASKVTGDQKYHDAMMATCDKLKWTLNTANQFNTNANDQATGHGYLDLYFQHKDPKMLVGTELALDDVMIGQDVYNMFNRSLVVQGGGFGAGGFGGFGAGTQPAGQGRGRGRGATSGPAPIPDASNPQRNPDNIEWWWSDALFMGPGVWARVAKATDNPKYLDYMNKNWWATSDHLYDKEEHLYARDETFKTRKEANGKKMFWSRGDGWVMGGFVQVIPYLPANFPDRQKYIDQFKEMCARLIQIQGPDGLWRSGMLDPEDYDTPENSGSAFFVEAMAWGINQGILDAKTYRPAVEKGWKGLVSHIYEDGRLGCIQQTGDGPAKFKATSSYVYGVGAFLMAGEQVYQLSKS